jgi:NB-ARC domain
MFAHTIDARYSTSHHVGRDQTNNYYTFPQVDSSRSPGEPPSSLSFNDAPIDLLSVHFTGREQELADIERALDTVHGDVPTRCAIHGMPGLGKTQLALQFAKSSFDKRRYSLVFWISATNLEKLNQGFTDLLNLVNHPNRFLPDQRARLTAARRWLEDSGSVHWLMVLDNVDFDTLGFLRDHLPRTNKRGSILCTTRTERVARAVASAAGQQHTVYELRLPEVRVAAELLLAHLPINEPYASISPPSAAKAEEIVRCVGCLPLAIIQAASFVTESRNTLDDLLNVYRSEQMTDVSHSLKTSKIPLLMHILSQRYSVGRTVYPATRNDPLRQPLPPNLTIWSINHAMPAIFSRSSHSSTQRPYQSI